MSNDDGFPNDPFGDDSFEEEINDEELFDQTVWENTNNNESVRRSSSGENSNASYVEEEEDDDDVAFEDEDFEEMEELWEEVEDDDCDDEMMDEDYEEEKSAADEEDSQQQKIKSSFRGLVDRPAQTGRRSNSLASLEEEDSNVALSSAEPSRNGAQDESSQIVSQSQRSQDVSLEQSNSVDFDLGSFNGEGSCGSDVDNSEDMEQACRDMIAVVHPTSDPDDMIHRCDLKTLYANLRQQYHHLIRKNPELEINYDQDDSEAGELWNSFGNMGENPNRDDIIWDNPLSSTELNGNGTQAKQVSENSFDQDPFESTDAWGSIKGEAVGNDDVDFDNANRLPASFDKATQNVVQVFEDEDNTEGEGHRKVEKWLERNADDPDDYEYGCRRLIQIMYDEDDEEHTPDTMLRRTTPKELYRYLKQQYWYMIHTGQLEENALQLVSMLTEDGEEPQDSFKTEPCTAFVSSNQSAASKLDAILVARKVSEKSLFDEEAPVTTETECTTGDEDELRLQLERVKEEELRLAAEEATLRKALEEERLGQKITQTCSPTEDDIHAPTHYEIVTVKGGKRFDELDTDNESRRKCSAVSTLDADTGDRDLLMNRDIDEDGSKTSARSNVIGDTCDIDKKDGRGSCEIDINRYGNMSQGQRFEAYTKEYNDMLDKCDNGEDIDEVRLYFLELAVRQRLDEDLTENELLDLSQFDEQEVVNLSRDAVLCLRNLNDECNESTNLKMDPEFLSRNSSPDDDGSAYDEVSVRREGSPSTNRFDEEDVTETSQSENNSSVFRDPIQDESTQSSDEAGAKSQGDSRAILPDPAELAWRKKKLDEDLTHLIERAEEEELEDLISPEAVVALKIASTRVAFTKKYFDATRKEHIYFPSVAKCVFDYSLIDAAETFYKDGKEDFPVEYANALCTVAASHLNGDVDEVDEGNDYIQNKAITVLLGDQHSAGSIELEMRRSLIEDEIATLILDAESQELEAPIEANIKEALRKGAMDAAHIKKVFDMKQAKFVYFPSVAKAVYNYSLIEAAETHLTNGDEEICLEYTNALCTIAASYLRGNVEEVDPDDVYVKTTAVFVDLGDGVERNIPEPDEGSITISLGNLADDFDEVDESKSHNSMKGGQSDERSSFDCMQGVIDAQSYSSNVFGDAFQEKAAGFDIDTDLQEDMVFKEENIFEDGTEALDSAGLVVEDGFDTKEPNDSFSSSVENAPPEGNSDHSQEKGAEELFLNLEGLSEPEKRVKLIEAEVASIIQDTEEKDLNESLPRNVVDILTSRAFRVAYLKKYFDVTVDTFIYFPSVSKTIVDYSLFENQEGPAESSISLEHIAALRASASRFLQLSDVDESDDYIVNMSLDVDIGIYGEDQQQDAKMTETTGENSYSERSSESKGNHAPSQESKGEFGSISMGPSNLSERDRLQCQAKDELRKIVESAEKYELGEEIDPHAFEALNSALSICYTMKYYDVLKDEVIFFPSVAKSIGDYSLTEEAEKFYSDDEEFPLVYVSSLREVAIALAANDDLDYEYMENLALPVDNSPPISFSIGVDTPSPNLIESDASTTDPETNNNSLPTDYGNEGSEKNIDQDEENSSDVNSLPTDYSKEGSEKNIDQDEENSSDVNSRPTDYGNEGSEKNIDQDEENSSDVNSLPSDYGNEGPEKNIDQDEENSSDVNSLPTDYGNEGLEKNIDQDEENSPDVKREFGPQEKMEDFENEAKEGDDDGNEFTPSIVQQNEGPEKSFDRDEENSSDIEPEFGPQEKMEDFNNEAKEGDEDGIEITSSTVQHSTVEKHVSSHIVNESQFIKNLTASSDKKSSPEGDQPMAPASSSKDRTTATADWGQSVTTATMSEDKETLTAEGGWPLTSSTSNEDRKTDTAEGDQPITPAISREDKETSTTEGSQPMIPATSSEDGKTSTAEGDQPITTATAREGKESLAAKKDQPMTTATASEDKKVGTEGKNVVIEEMEKTSSAEDSRLKEMAQILEFKRRVDKQKISDEAKALEDLKRRGRQKLEEETKRLEEEIRIAEERLEEEAALLSEKRLADERKIEEFLQELQATSSSELDRIESEVGSLDLKRQEEEKRVDRELEEIEKERLGDEAHYSQKLTMLRSEIAAASVSLEEERKKAEEEVGVPEPDEKKVGFFGFGGRGKRSDIEREKQKQAKLMDFKMREMEMEKEIQELGEEENKLKDQAEKMEFDRQKRRTQLDEDSRNLEKRLLEIQQRLDMERKMIEGKLDQGKMKYEEHKRELEETKKDDEAWIHSEKEKLKEKRLSGLKHLKLELENQMERERREEDRLRKNALAIKEKWMKEEAAFAAEVEAFEKSFGEFIPGEASDQSKPVEVAQISMETDGHKDEDDSTKPIAMDYERAPHKKIIPNGSDNSDHSQSKENGFDSITEMQERFEDFQHFSPDGIDEQESIKNVPDHLVALHQPKCLESFQSIDSITELFDQQVDDSPAKKPLLAAALMAKEKMQMNSSLSALDLGSHKTTKSQDLHRSVPDHLVLLNQPRFTDTEDADSMESLDVFDDYKETVKPSKPLLAAAMKAKYEQMAKSFSALEGLPPIIHDSSDFSRSVPSKLYMVNQPKNIPEKGDRDSIEEGDFFNPPKNVEDFEEIFHNPLSTAPMETKMEQLSKSLSPSDDIFLHGPKESSINTMSDVQSELDIPSERDHVEETIIVCSQTKSSDCEVDTPESPLKEVQEDSTPRRKKKQAVGLASVLAREAVAFKENSMNECSATTKENEILSHDLQEELAAKNVTNEMQPTGDLQARELNSHGHATNRDRMSWWKVNGKRLVDAQTDPSKTEDKRILTESLVSHNLSFAVTSPEWPTENPTEEGIPRSPARESLSEKTRNAAKDCQKAIAIPQKGSSPPEKSSQTTFEEDPVNEATFVQARQFLQNRVDAVKETKSLLPGGNAPAFDWAIEAVDVSSGEQEECFQSSPGNDPGRLDWWCKNGKRLVEEVQARAPVEMVESTVQQNAEPENDDSTVEHSERLIGDLEVTVNKSDQSSEIQKTQGMSRREILAEKRRQILEARKELKIVASTEDQYTSKEADSNGIYDKKTKREMEAHRLAERTRLARENRLAREAQRSEKGDAAPSGEDSSTAPLYSKDAVVSTTLPRPLVANGAPSLILQPMIREADRLSGFIRRYESKLETICQSMLTMVSEDIGSEEAAKAANEFSLPEMLEFISKQEWYKAHSAASLSSSPRTLGPPILMFSRSESKRAVVEAMNSEQGIVSNDSMYTVTAVGKAFLQMDGPMQADMARFLAHLDKFTGGLNRNALMSNWKEISRLSGDAQSQRICDKLDDMISFALAAHMIK
ncbi:hypothetical protein IV203_017028 [Nitzschia inconspicua]|uniref:Uncharacterized protein n=1 Tax=Nitzschia inconspicua TaxID=303405 RepID=A0A9K3KQY0_9STRA|nr:hypothetical protein IV203_017028 [Nitzschia inconspicua]